MMKKKKRERKKGVANKKGDERQAGTTEIDRERERVWGRRILV
jgi:hypothetical protein